MSKCKGGDSSIIQIYKKTPIMTAFYIKKGFDSKGTVVLPRWGYY